MPSFRVASFNLENFNRPGVFYAGRPGEGAYDEALFASKCAWIGGLLDEGEVDLVGFQEVFSIEALRAGVERSYHMNAGRPATVLSPETEARRNETQAGEGRIEASGPHVGLATRLEVLSSGSVPDFPDTVRLAIPLGLGEAHDPVVALPIRRFERPLLRARVVLPGSIPATVLVAHLKSKRPKFLPDEDHADPLVRALGAVRSLVVRAAEAVALRALALSIIDDPRDGERGEPLIVLGDLNDDLPSVTTQIVAGDDPPATWDHGHKQRLWDVQLHSVHDIQEARGVRAVSYTHIHDGRAELLDHIFVSQELVRQFPGRVAEVRSTRIFNDHLVDRSLALPARHHAHELRPPSTRSDHGVPVTEVWMRQEQEGQG